MADAPIGVFDSGVGGLTVVRAINERLPNETIVYLGDTARVPYGTKSATTVTRYGMACAKVLLNRDIKLLVVACNTASAFALPTLRESLSIPVIGVIEPGARAAIAQTKTNRIGVIGTAGTIDSDSYQRAIRDAAPGVEVFAKACPLFVPLAEEGWTEGDVPKQAAERYLTELRDHAIDTLVLGCTHYPLLRDVIANVMGPTVTLVDSAAATAAVVQDVLEATGLHATAANRANDRFMVSDIPNGFTRLGSRFLARELNDVEWVDF